MFSPFFRVKNGPVGSIDETCSGWGGMTNLFHLKILRKILGKYAKCIIIYNIHDYLGFMESIVGMCISKSTLLFSSGITEESVNIDNKLINNRLTQCISHSVNLRVVHLTWLEGRIIHYSALDSSFHFSHCQISFVGNALIWVQSTISNQGVSSIFTFQSSGRLFTTKMSSVTAIKVMGSNPIILHVLLL